MRTATKRLMHRCKWMVVRGLWMERMSEKVRMQMSRQISDRDNPTQVTTCNSNVACREERDALRRFPSLILETILRDRLSLASSLMYKINTTNS